MSKKQKAEKQKKSEPYNYEYSSAKIGKKVAAAENKRKASIILIALLLVALFITGIIYTVLYFVETNSFKIGVEESSIGGLSLSDNYSFQPALSYLSMGGPDKMDNSTYKWLDLQNIFSRDGGGSQNGKNYIAFTFYVRNDNSTTVNYKTEVSIENESKGIADALRLLVKRGDSDIRYYARAKADGTPEKLVPYAFNPAGDSTDLEIVYNSETGMYEKGERNVKDIDTIPYYDDNLNGRTIIMSEVHENLEPHKYESFTVVVWLEGEDPECVDGILGGKMRLEMRLSVEDGTDVSVG